MLLLVGFDIAGAKYSTPFSSVAAIPRIIPYTAVLLLTILVILVRRAIIRERKKNAHFKKNGQVKAITRLSDNVAVGTKGMIVKVYYRKTVTYIVEFRDAAEHLVDTIATEGEHIVEYP